VTARNSTGSSSATLAITVQAMSSSGGAALHVGKHALGPDSTSLGGLWNAGTGTSLGSIVWSDTRLTLLDSASGAPRSQILVSAPIRWWRLAVDGCFVAAATDEQLIVWAPTGEVLFSKVGYYGGAMVFAAGGELRIGAGAAGTQVIETITVPRGIARFSVPYLGSFHSWSEDGENFLAETGDSVWIYSLDASQIASLPGEPGVLWPDPHR
jgi:hypothetical protein